MGGRKTIAGGGLLSLPLTGKADMKLLKEFATGVIEIVVYGAAALIMCALVVGGIALLMKIFEWLFASH